MDLGHQSTNQKRSQEAGGGSPRHIPITIRPRVRRQAGPAATGPAATRFPEFERVECRKRTAIWSFPFVEYVVTIRRDPGNVTCGIRDG
jgi:hypothetical protein